MDPEQMAQLRSIYGNQPGPAPNRPTQAMQFGALQMPQHAPLQGPNLGGGGQGGGGGGQQPQGNVMEGAQKLIGGLMQNRGGRQPGQPQTAPAGPGPAGPAIVGSQAEMGPFQSEYQAPAGPPAVQGGSVVGGQPMQPPAPQPAPAAPQPPPMPPPRPAMPAGQPMGMMGGQGGMPQLMNAGGELPDWLFKLPRFGGGAMGL